MTLVVIMGNAQHIFLKLDSFGVDFEEVCISAALQMVTEVIFLWCSVRKQEKNSVRELNKNVYK